MKHTREETGQARIWLRENRPDLKVGMKGIINEDNWQEYYAESGNFPNEVTGTTTDTEIAEGEFIEDVEVAPKVTRAPKSEGRIKSKVKNVFRPATPRKSGKRAPVDGLISIGYSGLSWLMENLGGTEDNPKPMLPVARMMKMQAPAVGLIVEDSIKGTIADKVLQPFAKTGQAGETVFAIIGPPMLVAAITVNPGCQTVAVPMLREAMKSYVLLAGPAMKKAREREEKLTAELGEEFEADIDTMIQSLFIPEPADGE
jgi:hypothetical protein